MRAGRTLLPRLGRRRRGPAAMAMLGEPVGAKQAEEWGLIWRSVPDAVADDGGGTLLATHLATQPDARDGFDETGAATPRRRQHAGAAARARARLAARMRAGSADFQEGHVKAFFEKRPPQLHGTQGSMTPDLATGSALAPTRCVAAGPGEPGAWTWCWKHVGPGAGPSLSMRVEERMLNGAWRCAMAASSSRWVTAPSLSRATPTGHGHRRQSLHA